MHSFSKEAEKAVSNDRHKALLSKAGLYLLQASRVKENRTQEKRVVRSGGTLIGVACGYNGKGS